MAKPTAAKANPPIPTALRPQRRPARRTSQSEKAAGHAGSRAHQQRDRGVEAGALQGQAVLIHEVRREPSDEEIEPVCGAEVHAEQGPEVAVGEHAPPRDRRSLGRRNALRADVRQFRLPDVGVIGRIVRVPAPEEPTPEQPDRPERRKGGTPSDQGNEKRRDGRGRRPAQAGSHPHQTGGSASLAGREPAGEGPGQGRKRPGLCGAKQEANSGQRHESPHCPGQDREQRPCGNDRGHQPLLAKAVADPSRWNLEQTVGQGECAEDIAHADAAQSKVLDHERRGDGNADPVQVGDERHRDREYQREAAGVGVSSHGG